MPCGCSARPYKTVKRIVPRDPNDASHAHSSKRHKTDADEKVVYEKQFRKICLRGFANRELEQMMVRGLLR